MIQRILTFIIVAVLLSWLWCNIDPDKTYHWLGGLWHGMNFLPNLIRSIFMGSLVKAQNCAGGYNFFWWTATILSSIGFITGAGQSIYRKYSDN